MITKMMKCVSIAALLFTAILWSYAPVFGLPLRFLVGLSALLVATQALRARRRFWAIGFYAIAALFNPFVGVFEMAGKLPLAIVLATVAPFVLSLVVLKTQPLLSFPSITGDTRRSESL